LNASPEFTNANSLSLFTIFAAIMSIGPQNLAQEFAGFDQRSGAGAAAKLVRRTPVQERSNDTVQQILAATSVLLEQKPLDEVTTSRIAAEAGISIGGLYRFFPDKQAILDAIAVRAMEEFQTGLEQELSQSFPEDGTALLALVIDAYIRFLDARPDFRTIAFGHHISPSTRRRQVQPDIGPSGLIKNFMMNLLGVTETAELDIRLRIASEAGERLITYAYEQSPDDRKIVVEEMKRLLAGYLFG